MAYDRTASAIREPYPPWLLEWGLIPLGRNPYLCRRRHLSPVLGGVCKMNIEWIGSLQDENQPSSPGTPRIACSKEGCHEEKEVRQGKTTSRMHGADRLFLYSSAGRQQCYDDVVDWDVGRIACFRLRERLSRSNGDSRPLPACSSLCQVCCLTGAEAEGRFLNRLELPAGPAAVLGAKQRTIFKLSL